MSDFPIFGFERGRASLDRDNTMQHARSAIALVSAVTLQLQNYSDLIVTGVPSRGNRETRSLMIVRNVSGQSRESNIRARRQLRLDLETRLELAIVPRLEFEL